MYSNIRVSFRETVPLKEQCSHLNLTQKPLIDLGPLMNLKREPFDVLQPFAVGGQSFRG